MKTKTKIRTILIAAICVSFTIIDLNGQSLQSMSAIPQIGDKAPAFSANSTEGEINFPQDFFGKWKILFSHPAAYTPVCTSELIKLTSMQEEFEKLNCQVVGISTDNMENLIKWLDSIRELAGENGTDGAFNIPMISDEKMDISRKYGMVRITEGGIHPIRALYIIGPQDKVRAAFYYPFENGRNFDEVKRTLLAIQKTDRFSVLTPENWNPGDDLLMYSTSNEKETNRLKRMERRGVIDCDPDYFYCIRSSR